MSDFKFKCPFCGQNLSADEEWVGDMTQCPQCNRWFNIPGDTSSGPRTAKVVGGSPGNVPPPREFFGLGGEFGSGFTSGSVPPPPESGNFIFAIPEKAERIAARFVIPALIIYGLLCTILCLKNMFVSIGDEYEPTKTYFALAVAVLIAVPVGVRVAAKMMDALSKVITSPPRCKISSLNFFSAMTAIGVLVTVGAFFGGIFMAFKSESVQMFFFGLGLAVFCALLTIYHAIPEKFDIVADEQASPDGDIVTIWIFYLNLTLRLVPLMMSISLIVYTILIFPMIFTSRIRYNDMHLALMGFVNSAFTPLLSYLYYIVSYLFVALIRAILSLPGKLDALKK